MSDKKTEIEIPDDIVESFARCILPAMKEYFDSEDGQREFEKWKDEQDEKADIFNPKQMIKVRIKD